jgi:hypothetical protein
MRNVSVPRFVMAVVASAITVAILNGIITAVGYYGFLKSHSPLTAMGLWEKVQIPAEQTRIPALLLSLLCLGAMITTVVHWAGARSFIDGMRVAFIVGCLAIGTVNLGLLATTHYWSYTSAIVDVFVAGATFAVGGGLAATILGRANKST